MKWEKVKLDKLGNISRGRSKHRPRNDTKLFGGDYPFIQTADVKKANFYIKEYSETYNELGLEQSKLWDVGTLCITIAANIADTGILGIPACFPDSIMGFIPYDKISDVRFVKYSFDLLQRDCKQISQGTAQDNLSWEKLSMIEFPCPPIETQRQIADILSAYDDLIENNQKQIKLLEEAAQRLYKEWFVDLRFPGYEQTKIIDGVPEGWKISTLDKVANLKAGGDKPKVYSDIVNSVCKIPIYSNGSENEGLYGYTDKARILEECITISARGNVGYACLRRTPFVPIVRLISVIPIDIDVIYLYYYLRNLSFDSNGAAQQQITIPMIKEYKVIVPSEEILLEYRKVACSIHDKIDIIKNQNTLLKEARDRLLPKLMSGEIEV